MPKLAFYSLKLETKLICPNIFYIEIIVDLIPKSTEIQYNEKIPEVLRLIPTADQGKTVEVAFSKLLTLHKVFI